MSDILVNRALQIWPEICTITVALLGQTKSLRIAVQIYSRARNLMSGGLIKGQFLGQSASENHLSMTSTKIQERKRLGD